MKKFFLLPLALVTVSAFAAGLGDLNGAIVTLLSSFQNDKTQASLVFDRIETNEVRALAASASLVYKKTGPNNSVEISIPVLSYNFGDGTTPTTTVSGALKTDLTKILPQEDLNGFLENASEILKSLAGEFVSKYGEAVTIDVNVTEVVKDEAGNYVSVKGVLALSMDLSKLPEGMTADQVPVLAANAEISLMVTQGVNFSARVVSNPAYSAFQENNAGLKEILDLLVAQDPDTMAQLRTIFTQVDDFAKSVVGSEE